MFDFEPLVQAIIALLAAVVTALAPVVVFYGRQYIQLRWAEFEATQPEWLSGIIKQAALIAVMAVEQRYNDDLMADAIERKNEAMEIAQRWLVQMGFDLTEINLDVLDDAIEAVLKLEINVPVLLELDTPES